MKPTIKSAKVGRRRNPEAGAAAHCIGCGCHDFAACCNDQTGTPCSWLVVDRSTRRGVCSECHEHMSRWRSGDRTVGVSVDAREPCTMKDGAKALTAAAAGSRSISIP
jgi:hypothetical protein